jgi:hypothetical protein
VAILIIDEAQNVLSGTRDQQRRLLTVWRWLGNEMQIPIVAVGTPDTQRAIQSDEQLTNRFEPLALPLWRDDNEYRGLLRTLEALMPLKKPSRLARDFVAQKILGQAEGILGEIIAIVTKSAVQAIQTGRESISAEVIDEIRFTRATERRSLAR